MLSRFFPHRKRLESLRETLRKKCWWTWWSGGPGGLVDLMVWWSGHSSRNNVATTWLSWCNCYMESLGKTKTRLNVRVQ